MQRRLLPRNRQVVEEQELSKGPEPRSDTEWTSDRRRERRQLSVARPAYEEHSEVHHEQYVNQKFSPRDRGGTRHGKQTLGACTAGWM